MTNFSCAGECVFKNKGLQPLVIADTQASLRAGVTGAGKP